MIKKTIKKFLKSYGFLLVPEKILFDWQKEGGIPPAAVDYQLPPGAGEILRGDHPDLQELESRYAAFDAQVVTPLLWTKDRVSERDLLYFRGDNAYLYQAGSMNRNPLGYLLAAYYIKTNDPLDLWEQLQEPGGFGVMLFQADQKVVSRDLMDSILEINFLEVHLGISTWNQVRVLDIGAGYGRLAERMISALPNISSYFCTDAFPASTHICDYYIRVMGIEDKAESVPVDRIQKRVRDQKPEIALNIHSFSECTISAIDWWMKLLERQQVKHLMIVPNSGKKLLTNDGQDFLPIIRRRGYQRVVLEPKYQDAQVQKYAANPGYYHLFEFRG